ncbi:hypothetical protein GE09DRAFT_1231614 [Coniochaeta sp. 2T2.1]|nr:hypothetical protein GE09DRAFT_1231614 [Coniochaeta sp. 2T2.1]
MATHSDGKQNTYCTDCRKDFNTAENLKFHQKITKRHGNTTKWICRYPGCRMEGKCFTKEYSYRRHFDVVHKVATVHNQLWNPNAPGQQPQSTAVAIGAAPVSAPGSTAPGVGVGVTLGATPGLRPPSMILPGMAPSGNSRPGMSGGGFGSQANSRKRNGEQEEEGGRDLDDGEVPYNQGYNNKLPRS